MQIEYECAHLQKAQILIITVTVLGSLLRSGPSCGRELWRMASVVVVVVELWVSWEVDQEVLVVSCGS